MTVQTKLLIWLGSTAVIAAALIFTKRKRRESLPQGDQWLGLLVGTPGALIGIQNVYQAIALPDLQKILDVDGSIALVIGGLCTVWLSGKEIYKLFVKQKAPGN